MQIWFWILQWLFWKSFNCDKWTSLWWFKGLNYSVYMSIKMISIHWGILGICVVHWSDCKKRCFCVCSSSWFTGLGRPAGFLCMTTHRPGNCWQITTATHCWYHKTWRHSHLYLFTFISFFYNGPFHLFWSLLVLTKLLSLYQVSGKDTLSPCISLFLLDLWTYVLDIHKFI